MIFSSDALFRSIDLLAKARVRLLDHRALRFLNLNFYRDDRWKQSLATKSLRGDFGEEASFDFLAPPLPQSGSSKIVFSSNREGVTQIYVMNADGSNVSRLTYLGANDDCPRWSPNGAKILFQSDRDHTDTGYMDIYVINSDGSGVTLLTSDASDDSFASWSPDGSKIVFQNIGNGVNLVWAMNADGSSPINLTNTSSSDGEPSWPPDGTKIVSTSARSCASEPGQDC